MNFYLICFIDDVIEIYKRICYLVRGSEDFIKKYDMFSLKEISKYLGYMNYKIRVKLFKGVVLWMEVKMKEFVKSGFFY